MIRRLLLSALNKTKRVGRYLESRLNPHAPADRTFDAIKAPVIGYDAYLKGNNKGRVLLCYLTEPFHLEPDSPAMSTHQNMQRSIEIARIFNRLGYVVDVVDGYDHTFVPKKEYKVILGERNNNFKRMAEILGDSSLKLCLATGPHPEQTRKAITMCRNAIKKRRCIEIDFKYRSGAAEIPSRYIDAVIVTHNSYVASTYRPFHENIHCVGNGGFDFLQSTIDGKDFMTARNNFMFMASWLFLVRGLDLVLEVFSHLTELNLYVCGPLWNEPEFIDKYERELFHTPNIHVLGRIDLTSNQFKELSRKCAYVIYPCSLMEDPGSVWVPMRCGVIPVVSKEVDLHTEEPAIILPDLELGTIQAEVLEVANMNPSKCKDLALRVSKESTLYYSMEAWGKRFEGALQRVLERRRLI